MTRRGNRRVPFVDLRPQNSRILWRISKDLTKLVFSSTFILGDPVKQFEEEFTELVDGRPVIGVGNGTDAIELGLRALELPHGSSVLVPVNSFIATAVAVVRAGLVPRFVGFNEDTGLAEANNFAAAMDSRVSAIIPVHLYGQMANMVPIKEFAKQNGIAVLEDMAQSHLAAHTGISSGSWGDVAATSFYPGKNLGAWGDGGAIICRDRDLAEKVLSLRNYGARIKYVHEKIGFNSRLDPLQARVLSRKLRFLKGWTGERQRIAQQYDKALADSHEINPLGRLSDSSHVFHLYVVRVKSREVFQAHMDNCGVETMIHYPVLISDQQAFKGHPQFQSPEFQGERTWTSEIVSLPIFPGMTRGQIKQVLNALSTYKP